MNIELLISFTFANALFQSQKYVRINGEATSESLHGAPRHTRGSACCNLAGYTSSAMAGHMDSAGITSSGE